MSSMRDEFEERELLADVPTNLRGDVGHILEALVPAVTAQVREKRRAKYDALIKLLVEDVNIRPLDVRRAQMQVKAVRSVLQHSEWLTAEQIGALGGFSKSNLAAPAHRWKQEGKIFALPYRGQDHFPKYGLDETYRPLAGMGSVLKALGPITPWSIAAWFESTNAWLDNRRPRESLSTDPKAVLYAAQHYHGSGAHG